MQKELSSSQLQVLMSKVLELSMNE